jgi:hypothetical protein
MVDEVGLLPRGRELGDRDRGENADDRDDDEKLDQGEAFAALAILQSTHPVPPSVCGDAFRFASGRGRGAKSMPTRRTARITVFTRRSEPTVSCASKGADRRDVAMARTDRSIQS